MNKKFAFIAGQKGPVKTGFQAENNSINVSTVRNVFGAGND